MRVDLKKFLFFGSEKQKNEFFKKAQSLGAIEFVDHSGHKFDIVPEQVRMMSKAIKVLRKMPLRRQSTFENVKEASHIAEEITSKDDQITRLREELHFINQEIARVSIFGKFSRADITFIEQNGNRTIQYFFARNEQKVPQDPDLIYIGEDHNLHYFVSIAKERKSYDSMIEMTINYSLGELLHRKREVNTQIHQHEGRIKELAAFKTLIKQAIVHELNNHFLTVNVNFVEHHWGETMFSVEGWVAKNRVAEVEKMIEDYSIFSTEIIKDDLEVCPTHLENKGPNRIGEDLVHVYDTPSISDKDPSGWVLWAFALFFAFIVGDAGYGLVFFGLFLWMKLKIKNPSPTTKRFTNLSGILAIATVVWGCAIGSFFGIAFNPNSPVKKFTPLTKMVVLKLKYHMAQNDATYQKYMNDFPALRKVQNPYQLIDEAKIVQGTQVKYTIYQDFVDNIMLELSIFIGAVHLILSMVRDIRRAYSRVGWIFFLIGAYLWFPNYLKTTSLIHYAFGVSKVFAGLVGPYILLGGIAIAVIAAIIQNRLAGASELMNVIQVFSDVLSYLRLYALALAGAIMADTFNLFGQRMGIGFAVIVIFAGHLINISLSVMGGVIHGLRLNFLEWYHYSFEGGGKLHKPLALLKLYN